VVFVRMATELFPAMLYTQLWFQSLILGQLSVACIWTAFRAGSLRFKVSMSLLAVVVAALVTAAFSNNPVRFGGELMLYLGWYGLHAALLLAALWGLQRTSLWRRITGDSRAWQFSMAQLLVLMTVIGLLSTSLRNSPFSTGDGWLAMIGTILPVAFTVASVFIWVLPWHGIIRLASVVGCALLLAALSAPVGDYNSAYFTAVILLIQGLVLTLWMAWGQILPSKQTSGAPDNAGEQPQKTTAQV